MCNKMKGLNLKRKYQCEKVKRCEDEQMWNVMGHLKKKQAVLKFAYAFQIGTCLLKSLQHCYHLNLIN